MTKNQKQFISDAESQDIEVDMDYSGRGMYGKTCPAVYVASEGVFDTTAKYFVDSMGKGVILYARK